MGNPVRLVSFKANHCIFSEAGLVGFVAVALRLRERRVAQDGHDLFRGGAGLCEHAPGGFPQTVRLALQRQTAAVIASLIHWLKPSTVNGFP